MKHVVKESGRNAWQCTNAARPEIGDEIEVHRKGGSIEHYVSLTYHKAEDCQERCFKCAMPKVNLEDTLCVYCTFRCPDRAYWINLEEALEGL